MDMQDCNMLVFRAADNLLTMKLFHTLLEFILSIYQESGSSSKIFTMGLHEHIKLPKNNFSRDITLTEKMKVCANKKYVNILKCYHNRLGYSGPLLNC